MTAQRHPAPEPMFPMAPDKPGDDQEVQLKRKTLRLIQTDNRALRAALEDTARKLNEANARLETMTADLQAMTHRATAAEKRHLAAIRNQCALMSRQTWLGEQFQRLAVVEKDSKRPALIYSSRNRSIESLRDWLACRWYRLFRPRAESLTLACD